MPDLKNSDPGPVVYKTDELEEWRGKHHLLKKDYEAYQQRSEEKKRENEDRILHLRQENVSLRLHLGKLKNGDEMVIRSAFKDKRPQRLQLQRISAEEAIKTMDQKVCEGKKYFNRLKFERQLKEKQLKDLEVKYDGMVERIGNSPQDTTEQTIGKLENALDKVQIKLSTAQSISVRLEEIMEKLHKDKLKMPGKVDAMELALLEDTAERDKLRLVNNSSNFEKEATKRELMKVEQFVYETRKKRELELTQIKKEVARRKTETDKVEKKYQRGVILNEGQEQKLLEEQEAVNMRQQDILKYEDALQRIMDSSSVANINNVVGHYKLQLERKEQMKIQLEKVQKSSKKLKSERDALNEQYRKMKFSGDGELSSGQQRLDGLDNLIAEESFKMTDLSQEVERQGQVLHDMKQAAGALLHMFDPVKLLPPEHNFAKGDVFAQLETCLKKANMLMKQLNMKGEETNILGNLPPDQFDLFVNDHLISANMRVKLEKKESSMSGFSDFDFEGQEGGEQAPSRLEIKCAANKLVAQKMGKPAKRKRKEKGSKE